MGHQSHEGHRISIAETQPGQGLTKPGQGLTQPGQAFSLKLYPRQRFAPEETSRWGTQ